MKLQDLFGNIHYIGCDSDWPIEKIEIGGGLHGYLAYITLRNNNELKETSIILSKHVVQQYFNLLQSLFDIFGIFKDVDLKNLNIEKIVLDKLSSTDYNIDEHVQVIKLETKCSNTEISRDNTEIVKNNEVEKFLHVLNSVMFQNEVK